MYLTFINKNAPVSLFILQMYANKVPYLGTCFLKYPKYSQVKMSFPVIAC